MGPTVRLLGKASGVSVRELYRLFPRSPSYAAARIAGIPKLLPLSQRQLVECGSGGHLAGRSALTSRGVRHSERPRYRTRPSTRDEMARMAWRRSGRQGCNLRGQRVAATVRAGG
ncbi:MAG: hypothetical protein WCB51_08455 [Candidatus Dormiibacterota bacterium]